MGAGQAPHLQRHWIPSAQGLLHQVPFADAAIVVGPDAVEFIVFG